MATTRKTTGKTSKAPAKRKTAPRPVRSKAKPGANAKPLSESAQQIWLAGLGAFARAQAEGTRLFESLVKEGQSVEDNARKLAGARANAVREAVESRVGQVREQATGTWDRLEKAFEDRVRDALGRLGVPSRDDLATLSRRVDALSRQLHGEITPPPRSAARKRAGKTEQKSPEAAAGPGSGEP